MKLFSRLLFTLSLILVAMSAFAQRSISGVITSDIGEPLTGAAVIVKGTNLGTVTDLEGKFTLNNVPAEAQKVVISYTGYIAQETDITGAPIAISLKEGVELTNVVVIGSRSTAVRTRTETVAPVDVIGAQELQATGQVEPTQMIHFTAPSFNSNRQTVADGSDHIDPASLRGLGPDQVLVLVNGKRRYQTALLNINGTFGKGSVGTDLNSIPASSIDRIEVLRDGAASQYGSDAIAGVINVVLKKGADGSANVHYGQQNTNFLDRNINDGRTVQVGVNKGFNVGKNGGYVNFSFDARLRDSTNRSGDFLGTVYSTDAAKDATLSANWDRKNNMHVGNSNSNNYIGSVNVSLPIGTNMEFYAMGMLGYRKGQGSGFYRYPKQTSQVVLSMYPNGFLPHIASTINDQSVMAGIKGTATSGWRWDLSSVFGGNSFRFDVSNSNNATMGASSPREFYCGTLGFQQSTTNFDIAKDFGEKIGLQTFNVAAGAEFRRDMYTIKAGDEASWKNYDPASGKAGGAQVFPGFQPANAIDESRSVMGAYVDVETDISKMLLVNGAARIENYSDFGAAFAGKLAARVKLADAFSIRGAVSNGFRAPSMHQTWFNNTSTQFQQINGASVPSNTLTVKNSDPIASALGIDKLKAETSVNTSIGVTTRIADFLSLTVDAYQINIKDRVLLAGLFRRSNAAIKTILDAAGADPQVSIAQAFANMVDTRTRGLDIVAAASPKIGTGTLDITLAANFNETNIQAIKGSSKLPVGVYNANNIQFDRIEQSRLELGTPKQKIALGLTYRNKTGLGGTVRVTRFGEVGVWSTIAVPNTTPAQFTDEYYSGKTIADASINYTISKIARITIGANNLLDIYPDKLKWFVDGAGNKSNAFYGNTSEGRFVYSRNATQFGMSGRYIYAAVAVNF